jgi:L-ascorbate metabolism protein UlaG (beta-lactamase superfamily)
MSASWNLRLIPKISYVIPLCEEGQGAGRSSGDQEESRTLACGKGLVVKIKWYGHACFRLEGDGTSVVTDPYEPAVAGLGPVEESADLVVVSSQTDAYHSNARMIPGDPLYLNALDVAGEGGIEMAGVRFEAFPAMESLEHKKDPDENAMYRFELGGVSVLHLGDLGNPLTGEQLGRLRGRVDVLLALTGGPPTIELDDLDRAIEEIGPRVIIPMHYQIPGLTLDGNILPVEAFTSRFPEEMVVQVGATEIEITPDTLPDDRRVYVLEPAN